MSFTFYFTGLNAQPSQEGVIIHRRTLLQFPYTSNFLPLPYLFPIKLPTIYSPAIIFLILISFHQFVILFSFSLISQLFQSRKNSHLAVMILIQLSKYQLLIVPLFGY